MWPISERRTGHALLLATQICFSGWHVIGHVALQNGANPFVFVLYREVLACFLMYCAIKFQGLPIDVNRDDVLRFCCMGTCSFINVVGAMLALVYISPTRFAIFQPTIPCIATLLSIICKMESFTYLKIFGISVPFQELY